jgi:hypothetical protein
MRAAKTVFIVGAGASNEVGIEFGRSFVDIVSGKLNYRFDRGCLVCGEGGDGDILEVIERLARDRPSQNSFLAAAQRLREGLGFARSIDSFLDVHRDDKKIQLLGKVAIAKTILDQEENSCIRISGSTTDFQNVAMLNDSWFVNLARGLNDGVRREEIKRIFEKLSFIVFNYDRCVEHFLYNALQRHYGISDAETKTALETLTILHPYGKIANLPWQGGEAVPFGYKISPANLVMMASNIKTYTEQIEDDNTLRAIKSEIAKAETLVFLGFSYLDLNMDLIHPTIKCVAQNVFGTAYGISSSDVDQVKKQLRGSVGQNLSLSTIPNGVVRVVPERLYIRSDLKCAGLLGEYSRSLFATGQRSSN